jgi:glycerol-3-phosphate acyltransferase PlsY
LSNVLRLRRAALRRLGAFLQVSKKQHLGEDFVSHFEPVWDRLCSDHQKANACMAWIEYLQSANGVQATSSVVAAYFLGCFATGYYLVRARTGRDIRDIESGSTGTRNVGRILGKSGFVLTMLGDFGKGALAVWFAAEFTSHNQWAMALAVLAVVAGHVWPAQLRFRGGKGVATSFAALLLFDYRVALTILVVFLCGLAVTRKTLFPAMFAYVCLPLADGWFNRAGLTVTLMAILSAMILFAHRRNIGEEIAGLWARRGVVPKPESTKL